MSIAQQEKITQPSICERAFQERREYILPKIARILEAYFDPIQSADKQRGADVRYERRGEHFEIVAATKKRRGNEQRRNEDTIAVGDNWYCVTDGVTGREQNYSGIMGEVCAVVFAEIVLICEQHPELSDTAIIEFIKQLPDFSQKMLAETIPHTVYQERLNLDASVLGAVVINAADIATTVEAVYLAKQRDKAFLVHVGDSRTYQQNSNGVITKLTTDHITMRDDNSHTLDSCVSLKKGSAIAIQVEAHNLARGIQFVSVTDGIFASYEQQPHGQKFSQAIHDMAQGNPDLIKQHKDLMTIQQLATVQTADDASLIIARCR